MPKNDAANKFHIMPDDYISLLESACDWAFITDEAFTICYSYKCKNAIGEILPQNLINMPFENFLPAGARSAVMKILSGNIKQKKTGVETVYSDPLTGDYQLKARFIQRDSLKGYSITVRHIYATHLNYIQKELLGIPERNTEQNISVQLEQQRLIADLALEFAKNSMADVEELFTYTLQALGSFMGVDRCSIFRHDLEQKTYSVLYEWCAPDVPSTKAMLQDIPYNDDDEGFIQLTTRPYIAVDDTFQYTGEAYRIQRESGVHSFADLPILCNGQFWGFLGADYGSGPHYWTDSEFHMLQTIGSIMSSTLEKKEMQTKLEDAILAAERASLAKTEFLSRMSHEIRTPMNAIIGMNAIAQKTNDPQRIQYCLTKIDQASGQLLGIINDILDLSKIESGKMEIMETEFDFEKMLQGAYAVIQPRLEEKNISFSFDFENHLSSYVISDELRLTQVIVNLLSNAVKFTPDNGKVVLRTRFLNIQDDKALLRVEVLDTGIGINEEDKQKLFQAFEQADGSITRRFGGTGLGLSICKNILTLMNGKIWVESQVGQGSNFIFEVNVSLCTPSTTETRPMPAIQNARILVVDDDEDLLEYCRQIITDFQMRCDIASSGENAIAILKQAELPYHIIFIDWLMPGMDGIQTAQAIREIVSPDTIVIMISGSNWSDLRQQAEKIGVTHFLSKPLLPSTLYDAILKLLASEQSHQKNQMPTAEYSWVGKTVLLAEDIEINQEIIRTLLQPTGITIDCANNGVEALKLFHANPSRYDVILMDIQMPEMGGYETTQKIRISGHENAASIPIFAMTANAFSEDVEQCLAVGMNSHIAKPINVNELMEKMSVALWSPQDDIEKGTADKSPKPSA